jgi:uncharacterized protein YkwD
MCLRFVGAVLLAGLLAGPAARAQTLDGRPSETIEGAAPRAPAAGLPDLQAAAQLIVHRTNAFRQAEGRKPVTSNAKLTETARDFAEFMARTGKYGHEADGHTPAERVQKRGYEFCLVAENIAYRYNSTGFKTAELGNGFFESWKNSPGHRRNMLDPDMTETGVALARSEKTGYYYGVQLFGRPSSERIEFKMTNATDATVEYTVGSEKFTLPPRYIRTHQVCRPPEVKVTGASGQKEQTVQPANGERYVVRKDESGQFHVEAAAGDAAPR